MEIFLLVIIVILFIVLAKNNSDLAARLRDIQAELQLLRKELTHRNTQPVVKEETVGTQKKPVQETPLATSERQSGFKVMKDNATDSPTPVQQEKKQPAPIPVFEAPV